MSSPVTLPAEAAEKTTDEGDDSQKEEWDRGGFALLKTIRKFRTDDILDFPSGDVIFDDSAPQRFAVEQAHMIMRDIRQ